MDYTTLERLAGFICGDDDKFAPLYRTGWDLTNFFESVSLPQYVHDGSTRKYWVWNCLKKCSETELLTIITKLASPITYKGKRDSINLAINSLNEILNLEGLNIDLSGVNPEINEISPRISSYQKYSFECPDLSIFGMSKELICLFNNRSKEIEICFSNEAYLACLILMGSFLEGLLFFVANDNIEYAYKSKSCPVDFKTKKPKPINDWTLSQLIEVAFERKWIGINTKRYSHELREFRNSVHPNQQLNENIFPDKHTCIISWDVIQSTISDLWKLYDIPF